MQKALYSDIKIEFPNMPPYQAKIFAKQISKNRNPGNAIIPQKQFIHTQVKACIRHKMTAYEQLIILGIDKNKAREVVNDAVERLYNKWKSK